MNGYVRPAIEFETFELNSAIANSCGEPLPFAPTGGEFEQCEVYEEIPMTMARSNVLLMSAPASGTFSDNNECYCSLSSTGDGFGS